MNKLVLLGLSVLVFRHYIFIMTQKMQDEPKPYLDRAYFISLSLSAKTIFVTVTFVNSGLFSLNNT
jgi:hypothetical protein